MLTAANVLKQIHANDETFRLFCSIAAKGESQGGWENARIAALVPDPHLVPRIARHGADEDKHGRIFDSMLHRRGLEPVEVPDDADYCMRLERLGIGLAHERLRQDEAMISDDVIVYLAHSRVTEQRAAEEMRLLDRVFGDDPDVGRAIRMICDDEEKHLAYCHEELLRLADQGHRKRIDELLRETALAEIKVHRDVSLAVMARMGTILGWSRARRLLLATGIRALYAYDRVLGLRRLTRLRTPERKDALGPAPEARLATA